MASNLKILQLNKYPSFRGGAETVLFDTIRLLEEKGHDVILYSTDERSIVHRPTYTIPYPKRSDSFVCKANSLSALFYNRKAAKKLQTILEDEKPDIAHIHLYLNGLSVSVLPVLRHYGIPVVMTLHDYREICPSYLLLDRTGNTCEKCMNGNYLNCIFTRCSKGNFLESSLLALEMYFRRTFFPSEKYVDRFVCVSNFIYKKIERFNPSIAAKSVVIHNPVRVPSTTHPERGKYLLFFGRLSREKGIPVLLDAMKGLPGMNLKIAGTGDMKFENIPANVEFVGFKSKDELTPLIRQAMFTVVPTQSYESFGLSCVESLALGTPVIASDMGALPEIVKHGETGFLFTAGNVAGLRKTIEEAVNMPETAYKTMSNNARESVAKFSEEDYICKLIRLYEELITAKCQTK